MIPHASLIILLAYTMGLVYLILIGFLGAIYGEPLGFLFLALGITASIPFYNGSKQFFEETR